MESILWNCQHNNLHYIWVVDYRRIAFWLHTGHLNTVVCILQFVPNLPNDHVLGEKKKQRNEHVVIHFPDFLHDQSFYCIFSKFQMIVYRKTNVHKILVNNRGNKDLANKSFLVTWTWLRITSFNGIITYTNTRYTTIQRRWRITFTVSRSFAETTSARTFGKLCPSTPITIDWNQTSIYDNIDPLVRIYQPF